MDLIAFILASVAISRYLDKKSKIGNISFSILFIFVFAFYLIAHPGFVNAMPFSQAFKEAVVVFQQSAQEVAGVAAMSVIRIVMASIIVAAIIMILAFIVPAFASMLFAKAKRFSIQTYSPGKLLNPAIAPSSISTACPVPMARTPVYIEFGVLRN